MDDTSLVRQHISDLLGPQGCLLAVHIAGLETVLE